MDCIKVYKVLITISTVTCISDKWYLHIDGPTSNLTLKLNEAFLKTRFLIPIYFPSTLINHDPLLGRVGSGPRVYIVALFDYPLSFI